MTNYEITIKKIIGDLRWLASSHNTMAEYKKRMCINAVEAFENLLKAEENKPLTLDELRQMHGEPVWVRTIHDGGEESQYCILDIDNKRFPRFSAAYIGGIEYEWFGIEDYGKTWTAYRRKPKEE